MGQKIVMQKSQGAGSVLPENTLVVLRSDSVQVEKATSRTGGEWEKLVFRFKLLEVPDPFDDLIGESIWGDVPFRFTDSPDNRLRQWAEALLGVELSEGYELDIERLVNRKARGVVGNYFSKTKNRHGHKIVGLLPLGQTLPQIPQPQETNTRSFDPASIGVPPPSESPDNIPF